MSGQLIRWILAFAGAATLAASLIPSALRAPAAAPTVAKRDPASVDPVERELILNKIREGDLYWMRKDLAAAQEAWRSARRLGEGLWPIHEGLGDSYARAKLYPEALREWETAEGLVPEKLAPFKTAIAGKRAATLESMGRPQEALRLCLDQGDPARFGAAILKLSDADGALSMIEHHADIFDPRLYSLLSVVYSKKSREVDAAEALARFAIQVAPWDAILNRRAIAGLVEAKRFDRALEVCRAWIRSSPQAAEAYETFGDVLWESGRQAEALVAYTSIVDVHPGEGAALLRLGEITERRGRPAEAMALYERGLKASPNDEALKSKVVAKHLARLSVLKAEGRMDEVRALRRLLAEFKVQEAGLFDFKIVMTWDVNSDVDLDIYEPDGTRINHANRTSKVGGAYYTDNTHGQGPETYTIAKVPPGTWRVGAHLHSGAKSAVKIVVILYEDTPQEQRREETLVLQQVGETTTFVQDVVIP